MRAESRTERSQHKNNDNALKLLKARLYAIEEQKRLGDMVKRYDAKGEIAFGSQIRSYVMQPYTLVREERDGIDVKTPAVMRRARRRPRRVHARLPAAQDREGEQAEEVSDSRG